ncbi:alpha-1,2-fucosyltransferase [Paenibacillus silviterrae]|uniref:alpha-1,2-fucosyltransferase n=1 Tax=Paenibacillus silviterrae TaxID=3242194 RepID=UPI00254392B4|nr:alpha-1,2-fucosyltransferase [Paenibacillus chinjuensis]
MKKSKATDKPAVSIRCLGKIGRFGNQVFQYAFVKVYAHKYNLRVETPEWIGQYLFGHKDPPIQAKYKHIMDKKLRKVPHLLTARKPHYKNVDLKGYFLFHPQVYASYKSYFRSLFQPVPEVRSVVEKGLGLLKSRGNTIVGLHLRRGDFLANQHRKRYQKFFPVVPNEWYIAWLRSIWGKLDNPVLFIASDEPELVLPDFREFKPVTSSDLNMSLPKASFYPDYYILSNCDILAISYSTFSYSASMLNRRGKLFVRPIMELKKLVPYDPWNSKVKPYQ